MDGRQASGEEKPSRSVLDWLLVAGVTCIFLFFAGIARVPKIQLHWVPAALLTAALLLFLLVSGVALWRTTRFN
jgi:hypothetical protein